MIPTACLFALLCVVGGGEAANSVNKPNVVIIVADDLGWNDVGFHGSNQIPTPNLDALAFTGVILDNYYVQPVCTPSRSALMTGKYPIRTGLQHGVILGSAPYGLDLSETILPRVFKANGYVTRGVGKWHLGHFRKEYTPEERGFDSHYGYWLGRADYYDHSCLEGPYWGYDMKRGLNGSWSDFGNYSTDLFTAESVKIIDNHNPASPLFLYVAHQAVHSGNSYSPLQAPPETIAKFGHIRNKKRRKFAGMLSKLDDSVGEIVTALQRKNLLNNSIIVFTSDNGGPAAGFDSNAASNWPLRGVKSTLWQGGVKGAAFVWSPLISSGVVSTALMHVTDWLPTLVYGATGRSTDIPDVDGFNLWRTLAEGKPSPRKEVLINIDPVTDVSGLVYKNWKIIKGHDDKANWSKWFGPSGRRGEYDWNALTSCKAAKSIRHITPLPPRHVIQTLRNKTSLKCRVPTEANNSLLNGLHESDVIDIDKGTVLFNLDADPCETNDLSSSEPERLSSMLKILAKQKRRMVEPRNKPSDKRSDPKLWGYEWINWMDHVSKLNLV